MTPFLFWKHPGLGKGMRREDSLQAALRPKMLRFSKRTLKVEKKRQVLTALKGAKGWETVEEKLGKFQSTGNSRGKGKNNLSSLALLWMSSSQLGKVILFLHTLPKIPVAIRKACLESLGGQGKAERRRVVN